ncbi:hypothetical protein ACFL3Q_03975 [Planctomycetota bacterium]
MTLEGAAHTANIVLAFVALAGVYYWIVSFRQFHQNLLISHKGIIEAERASRIQALRQIFDLLEECRKERHLLEDKIAANPSFDVLTASPAEKLSFDKLARSYDILGALVKHGVAPIEFVMDFYSRPLVKGWIYLEPMVAEERRTRKQPGHMLKFQILATGAAKYRKGVYPNEQSFDSPKELVNDWIKWSRTN